MNPITSIMKGVMIMADTLTRGAHITDKDRTKLAKQYARRYNKGESIRAIAEEQGRSFGFVHSLLKTAGVELRSRGTAKGTRLGPRGPRSKKAEQDEGYEEPQTEAEAEVQTDPGEGFVINSDQTVTEPAW